MKKSICLCLILCMLLAAVPALAAPQYAARVITFEDVTVSAMGEEIALNPSFVLTVAATKDMTEAFLTLDVVTDDGTVTALMAEEKENGASRWAFSTGDTCAVSKGKDSFHRLLMADMGISDIPGELSHGVDMLFSLLERPKGVEYLFTQLGGAKKMRDRQYAVTVRTDDVTVSGVLSWQSNGGAKKSFSLDGLKEVSASGGLMSAEGFEEARSRLEDSLMSDPTMEELFILMMLLEDQ